MKESEWTKSLADAARDDDSAFTIPFLLRTRRTILRKPHGPKEYGEKCIIDCLFDTMENKSLAQGDWIAKRLADALGAKLSTRHGKLERTALHQAVVNGRAKMVSHLLSHTECARFINLGDIEGRTAIHEAAARGNETILQDLLRVSGVQLDIPDSLGMTPLHLVIWLSEKEKGDDQKLEQRKRLSKIAQVLIEVEGAEVNTRDQFGRRPPLGSRLFNACQPLTISKATHHCMKHALVATRKSSTCS